MSTAKDPNTMTLDELRQMALDGLNEQPRDEQGRFRTLDEPAEAPPPADEEVVYQHTVDLGDGSGTQVFEGKTLEELVEKLGKAQEHATRKIREQAQALKEKPAALPVVEPEKQLSEHEKWLLQQRMIADPMSVIGEYVQREVGKLEQTRQAAETAAREAEAAQKVSTDQWVADNPDYYPSDKNGNKITKFLQTQGLDLTSENLTTAYNDLNASGLLEARPTETPAELEGQEQPSPRRIVEAKPVTTTVRRKVVGGLSTKRSTPVTPAAPGLTEDELYKMPLHKLEQLAYQQFRGE